MHRSHYDVGIIGSGIAGAALATALTRQGFTVALLDRRPGLLDTARGDHIQPGVQPLLERWGVLESLMLAGAEKRYGTRWLDG
ncbi:MAG: FAD-dependent oxidoreductase, partial [Halieaceae bacterium]|nr:FAD-dependent oxidoreductase [Halieaceae bacterium]